MYRPQNFGTLFRKLNKLFLSSYLSQLAVCHFTNQKYPLLRDCSGLGTDIQTIWSSVKQPISLSTTSDSSTQLYLKELQEEMEIEITNKKHISNQPGHQLDTLPDIDKDAKKGIVFLNV